MKHSHEFITLVNEARQKIRECDVHTVRQRQLAGETFHLFDVREESEFERAFIPGAKHLGRGVLEVKIVGIVPDKSTDLVLYCGGGYRSALAAANLVKMGYTRVTSMDGGFRGWLEAGYPVLDHEEN
jgi:rhodanese-related sulfurtransferase